MASCEASEFCSPPLWILSAIDCFRRSAHVFSLNSTSTALVASELHVPCGQPWRWFFGFFATFQKWLRKRVPRRDFLCVIHSSGMQLQRTTPCQSFLECRRETLSFSLTGGLIIGAQMLPVLHASVLIKDLRVWRCAVTPWMQTIKCSLLSVLTLW